MIFNIRSMTEATVWTPVLFFCILLNLDTVCGVLENGMLFPRESESRQIQDLDGMWSFRADQSPNRREGLDKMWYKRRLSETGPVIPMPVSSSFNDITADRTLQYFVGWVWYDREFFVSPDWSNRRVILRIGSAHYNAIVWLNGIEVLTHSGGHLPFEAVVNSAINFSMINWITVAINNTLTPHTLPPGTISYYNTSDYPPGYFVQKTNFDFFNYAGIHRKVQLYTTPLTYIDDITIVTGFSETIGYLNYTISAKKITRNKRSDTLNYESSNELKWGHVTYSQIDTIYVEILDLKGVVVAQATGNMGSLVVSNVKLWWPFTMSRDEFGYRYTLKAMVGKDIYRQPFGFRTVRATDTQLLINEQPFYCHGAAKHEDSDIRGKGLDFPLIARDFNMLKWLGVNCFRTSHYPYAEEIMDQADEQGIVVIDECPGVGIKDKNNFENISLIHHLEVMSELVRRDKNRPSVIMWSVANEPSSNLDVAEPYFKSVIEHTRQLDRSRLVTFVIGSGHDDKAAKYTDILCVNRYYGWYEDTGVLETISYKLSNDLIIWHNLFKKPIIMTEYGADTVTGLHTLPSFAFTEDYQADFIQEYHAVFDVFRKTYLVGEMIWNFADFMTDPTVTRVVGNKKGVLTRQRQPKMSAHVLRKRYWKIINETLSTNNLP